MQLRERLRRRGGDDGFTLMELIMTIAIMGVIVAALTGIVISYLKTTVDTQARMTESQDVQFVATYWQRDVASIGIRSYNSATKDFDLVQSVDVAPACTVPAGVQVVTLGWSQYDSDDTLAAPKKVTVTYLYQADSVKGGKLQRVRCTEGTLDSNVVVARSLADKPEATCDTSCTSASVPALVYLSLKVLDPEGKGTVAYTAKLSGERRQS